MAINTLNNKTLSGQNTGNNQFQTFQTQLQNLKKTQKPTALSNFFTLAKGTNRNINAASGRINDATTGIKNTWSDENIDKSMTGIKDTAIGKINEVGTKAEKGFEGVSQKHTISFPGSPSDEEILAAINPNMATVSSGGKTSAESDRQRKSFEDDLADDGIINRPENAKILSDMKIADIPSDPSSAALPAPVMPEGVMPHNALAGDTRDWGAMAQKWMNDANSENDQVRSAALQSLTKLADYGILGDLIKQDTWADKNQEGILETEAYDTTKGLEGADTGDISNAYALLGGQSSGNAYMDAMNKNLARPDIINALGEAQDTTKNRDAANAGYITNQKQYMDTVKEREAAYNKKGAETTIALDAQKLKQKEAIEAKYKALGYTPEQIASKVAEINSKQSNVKKIEADRQTNQKAFNKYMETVRNAKTTSDLNVARKKQVDEFNEKHKSSRYPKEVAETVVKAAEKSGKAPDRIISELESMTSEQLNEYITKYQGHSETAGTISDGLEVASWLTAGAAILPMLGTKVVKFFIDKKLEKAEEFKKKKELSDYYVELMKKQDAEAAKAAKAAGAGNGAKAAQQAAGAGTGIAGAAGAGTGIAGAAAAGNGIKAAQQAAEAAKTADDRIEGVDREKPKPGTRAGKSTTDAANSSTGYRVANGNYFSGRNGDDR